MKFKLDDAIQILERTPQTFYTLLHNIEEKWSTNNEGAETWSPHDIIGHLIHCDLHNWIPRIQLILSSDTVRSFEPFDRFAQMNNKKQVSVDELLDEFMQIRHDAVEQLREMKITASHLNKTALHPELGTVTLSQLIATWTAHDLAHLAQTSRVMAKQYKEEVGPWKNYIRILQ